MLTTYANKNGAGQQSSNFWDDSDFLDRLTWHLCNSPESLKQAAPVLTSKDFEPLYGMRYGKQRWVVAERALNHFKRHHEPLGLLLRSEVLSYARELRLGERAVKEFEEYLQHLAKIPLSAPEAVVGKIVAYKQERLRASIIQEMSELQAAGQMTPEKWSELTSQVSFNGNCHTSPQPITGDVLIASSYPEPEFAAPDLPVGGVTFVAGKPKQGKSFLMLQAAIGVAQGEGQELLGRQIQKAADVLYYSLEDHERRLQDRIRMLLPKGHDGGLERFHSLHQWEGIDAMRATIERGKYKIVIVDPYLAVLRERKMHDIVRSDYQEVQAFRSLAKEFSCAVVVVHHLRKAAGESRDLLIGTSGLTAAADCLWVLTNAPDGDGKKLLHITGRDVVERSIKCEMRFSLEDSGWHKIAEGAEAEAPGPLQLKILDLLRKKGPMGPGAIARALATDPNTISVTLGKMCGSGLARKESRGTYAYPSQGR